MTPERGFGQRPGGVQNALQHRVEVKALVDAQAGLGQPGQPVPQLRYLPLPLFGLVHLPALTGPQTACSSLIRDAPGPAAGSHGILIQKKSLNDTGMIYAPSIIRWLASPIGEIHLAFVRSIDALAKPGL